MLALMRTAQQSRDPAPDVNARNIADYTALIWATRENPNPEVVRLLLVAGANSTLRGVGGRRAVEFLAANPAVLDTAADARLRGR
jgi:ankyrin repeat protein